MPSLGEIIFIVVFSVALSLGAGYFDLGVGWRRPEKRKDDDPDAKR